MGTTPRGTASAVPKEFEDTALTARDLIRHDELAVLVRFDFEIAPFLGAALAKVPVGAARDCDEEGKPNAHRTNAFRALPDQPRPSSAGVVHAGCPSM